MVHYTVEATGQKGAPPTSLIDDIKTDDPAKAADREEIAKAEQYVPDKFECTAHEVDPATRKPDPNGKLKFKKYPIPVTIERSSAKDYDVKGSARPTLVHLNLLNPFPLNYKTKPGDAFAQKVARMGYQKLPDVGDVHSQQMLDNRASLRTKKGAIDDSNMGFLTSTMVKKWEAARKAGSISYSWSSGGPTKWSPEWH